MSEEPIDYSHIEAEFAPEPEDTTLDRVVVVDGAPVAPATKVAALTKVLKKLLSKAGPIAEPDGFVMPTDDNGATLGFVFVEFETRDGAEKCVGLYNNKKLDLKHTLKVDKASLVPKVLKAKPTEDYTDPVIPPPKKQPHYRSWLTDKMGRDQAVVHHGDKVALSYFRKDSEPERQAQLSDAADKFVRWSPSGTFLVVVQAAKVTLHAGPKLQEIAVLPHKDVRLIDFSPDESIIVTASREPISGPLEPKLQPLIEEPPNRHNIAFWSTETFLPLGTFPMMLERCTNWLGDTGLSSATLQLICKEYDQLPVWPQFRFSADSKYFARISAKDTLSIYETSTMGLVGKKSLEATGIADFSFAPATTANGIQLLAYWTPEAQNQTARICLVDAATKTVVRSRSLFNVVHCHFYWQNDGKYLAVKVDKYTKNKKNAHTSLEIYQLNLKNIPVEAVELKEIVTNLAFEPRSDRFVCMSYQDSNGPISASRYIMSFYALEHNKLKKGATAKFKEAYRFEGRSTNFLAWAPRGRFLVTATFSAAKSSIEFWDADYEGGKIKNAGVVQSSVVTTPNPDLPIKLCLTKTLDLPTVSVAWDPSSRYLVSVSSSSYSIFDIAGTLLHEVQMEKFKAFLWRPRPKSILPKEKRSEAMKKLKELSVTFDAEDQSHAQEESFSRKKKNEDAIAVWNAFRARMVARLEALGIMPEEHRVKRQGDKFVFIQRKVLETHEEVVPV